MLIATRRPELVPGVLDDLARQVDVDLTVTVAVHGDGDLRLAIEHSGADVVGRRRHAVLDTELVRAVHLAGGACYSSHRFGFVRVRHGDPASATSGMLALKPITSGCRICHTGLQRIRGRMSGRSR